MKNTVKIVAFILLSLVQIKAIDKKQYAFYWGDFDSYAARFDLEDSVQIDGVNFLMKGDSIGIFRLRVLGDEAGSSYPSLCHDILLPIFLNKDKKGFQEFTVKFDKPLTLSYPQFFVLIDSVPSGITVVSNMSEVKSVCNNELKESFYHQMLHSRIKNKWIYGKYDFIIEPIFAQTDPGKSIFSLDDKLNESFPTNSINSNISIADFNDDSYLDILYSGQLYLNDHGIKFDSVESCNYSDKHPLANIIITDADDKKSSILFVNCEQDGNNNIRTDNYKEDQNVVLENDMLFNPVSYSVTDLNSDGFDDIIMVNKNLNIGDTSYSLVVIFNSTQNMDPIAINATEINQFLSENSTLLVGDFNHDRNPDIFITGKSAGIIVTYNTARNTFNTTKLNHVGNMESSDNNMAETKGSSFIDYNNDGIEDILCIYNKSSEGSDDLVGDGFVYILDPLGNITDKIQLNFGIEENQSIATGDIDNNGREDVFISTSCNCKRPQLYLSGNQQFNNLTTQLGITEDYLGKDALIEDINNDGKLDLISVYNGKLKVYTNQIQDAGNYIELDFGGLNKQYRAEVYTNNSKFSKTLVRGRGFLVQGSPRLYFGIGNSTTIDSINIYENENLKYSSYNIEANKIYKVTDFESKLPGLTDGISVTIVPNPFNDQTKITCNFSNLDQPVRAFITNAQGSIVEEFYNDVPSSGTLNLIWNGTNNKNEFVMNGLYFFNLVQGVNTKVIRLIKIK